MVSEEEINQIINKIKIFIKKEIQENNFENALNLISVCGSILYQTNLCFRDEELEGFLGQSAQKLILVKDTSEFCSNDDVVLFWDGFGLDNRGLAKIYLKALCKIKHVVYVSYKDRESEIPEIIEIIKSYGGELYFIDRKKNTTVNTIFALETIVKSVRPGHFVKYTLPDDVISTTVLYAYKERFHRYIINLTDHAFWLGVDCIDFCIEFRNFGASVSYKYRKINLDKIVIIPYYPIINQSSEFLGYPFELRKNQKVIFSGGSLYKTEGEEGRYYKFVSRILDKYPDVIFWYAGSGDASRLNSLKEQFPKRVYHTDERKDLFQVMCHCTFYLNTYPITGGLMAQYAALAGKVPITLRSFESLEGILVNYNNLNVEFDNEEEIYIEIEKLLNDENYYAERTKRMLHSAVISQNQFEMEIKKLFAGDKPDFYPVELYDINDSTITSLYLRRFKINDIDAMLIRKKILPYCLINMPFETILGGWTKLYSKWHGKFK